MTITARFSSVCPRCRRSISVGDQVEWNRGEKARHLACQAYVASQAQPEPKRIPVDEVGVYVLPDGAIVKVQPNKDKTRTYAKRWIEISGQRLTEADTRVRGEYQFEPGLVQRVAADGRRMNLDEAKAFILRYGVCARCGLRLKDARSVERGIGPVCIRYFSEGATGAQLLAAPAAPRTYDEVFVDDDEQPHSEPRTSGAEFAERGRWTRPGDDELEHAAGLNPY